MIQGITVKIGVKTQDGVDAFNKPIYTYTFEDVENVLVGEPTTDDITSSTDLYGKKVAYTLGIPKGDTHNWNDTLVMFFGSTFHTFGFPVQGIDENIPLSWNKKVKVEAYE